MNPIKSEVKILTAESIGRHLESMVEGAHKKIFLQQGAKESLEHASSKLIELMAHVDKDLDEGVLQNFIGEPLLVASYVKKYIKRAAGVLDNLATRAEISRLMCAGQEKGFIEANKYVNGLWQEEREKLVSFLKALEETPVESSENGQPGFGLPFRAQRVKEESLEKAKQLEVESLSEEKIEAKSTVKKKKGSNKMVSLSKKTLKKTKKESNPSE